MEEGIALNKGIVQVAVPKNVCQQCSELVENIALFTGGEKTNTCLKLELLVGRVFIQSEQQSRIICRNCADRDETLTNKVEKVRENVSRCTCTKRSF